MDANNIIEDNTIVGNANGIFMTSGVHGNIVRNNLIVGNPPVQVSVDHTSSSGFDIKNAATAGTNTFGGNVCLTGVNAPCPALAPPNNTLLIDELQSLGCGSYPPTASCKLTVNQWNYYLTMDINPNAPVLDFGSDGSQLMTVQEYVQARQDAGI